MNRSTVRIAVFAALGLTGVATANPGGETIPELENPLITSPPARSPTAVAERWRILRKTTLAQIGPEVVAKVEARLAEVPARIGPPVAATQHSYDRILDLTQESDRIDSVLICAAGFAEGQLERCDLHGVLEPGEALKLARATPSSTSPWLGIDLVWRNLAATCEEPIASSSCSGGPHIDGRTGVCTQGQYCRRGRAFAGGRTADLLGSSGDARTAAGLAWAQVALDEHASIASFARHTLELLAIGAPTELVQAAIEAQQDEAHHARLALGLARHFGADVQIGALDTQGAPLQDLVDVLLAVAAEGCLGETLAAVERAIALEQTEDPAVRAVLEPIVADESRHAALAWNTLAWGLPQLTPVDRAPVLAALDGPAAIVAPPVPRGIGILGGMAAQEARAWGLQEVVAPAIRALVA